MLLIFGNISMHHWALCCAELFCVNILWCSETYRCQGWYICVVGYLLYLSHMCAMTLSRVRELCWIWGEVGETRKFAHEVKTVT